MDRLRDRRARCSPISIEKYTRASLKKPRPGRIDRSIGRNVSRRRSVPGVIHRFRWALGTDGIARRTGRGGSPWPPMSPDDHPPLRRSFASPDSPEYSAQKKGFCGTGSSKTRGGVRASGNRGLLTPVVAALRDCFSAQRQPQRLQRRNRNQHVRILLPDALNLRRQSLQIPSGLKHTVLNQQSGFPGEGTKTARASQSAAKSRSLT